MNFQHVAAAAPLLTSPVHEGGTQTPSPHAGRVGVGGLCLNLTAKALSMTLSEEEEVELRDRDAETSKPYIRYTLFVVVQWMDK